MCRPTILVTAALLASFSVLYLLTELVETQAALTASSAGVDGDTLTITLSAAVDASSEAEESDFTATAGEAALSIDSASVDGTTITLSLAEAVGDPDCDSTPITVSYERAESTITAAGTELQDFANLAVTNRTDNAPQIESIETDTTGRFVYVTFCEAVATGENGWLTIAAYTANIDGSSEPINDVFITSSNPKRLEIQFGSTPISEGDSVTVAYDRSDADDGDPPQDADQGEQLVQSWTARDVTNRVDSPPELDSATALWDVITLTYSEALDEDSVPDKSSFTISDKPYELAINSVAVSGSTVSLTVSEVIRGNLDPGFQLSYTPPSDSPLQQADGAKQAADFTSQSVVSSTPTTKPVVDSAAVNGNTLTITFDMPLKSVAPASALTVGGVEDVSVSAISFSGSVVTLTLSAAVLPSDSLTVTYAKPEESPRIEARNNRDADSFSNQVVTNNTPSNLPTFVSAAINAAGDTLSITMSKALLATSTGVPGASAFTLAGGTAAVSGVSVKGATVALTLSPKADVGETITVAYTQPTGATDGKLQSLSGGHLVDSWTAQSVTNGADGVPRPTGATVNGSSLAVRFDRTLDNMSTPAASAFSLTGATATVSSVSIAGSTVSLALSAAVAHDDTIVVSYTKPEIGGIKRSGQALFSASFSSLEVTNATVDPTPTFVSAAINAAGDTLTITMSKALLATSTGVPGASAFTHSGGNAAVSGVSVKGKTVSLALSPKADVGETTTIAYTQPTAAEDGKLQSLSGGHLVDSWSAQSVTNDADGVPRPTGATVNRSTLTITFDRALDTASTPTASTFSPTGATATVSSVSIAGSTVSLALSAAVAHDETIVVSYTKPETGGIKRSGQALFTASFSSLEVTNATPDPTPTFVSAAINAAGDTLSITMSKALLETSAGVPESSAFTLAGGTAAVSGVSVDGSTVALTLSPKADLGETITVAYTQPTGAMDGKLQSLSGGHLVDSWSAQSVTNGADGLPRPTGATVNGSTLAISFDRALDTMSKPSASAFSLSGATATVSSVSIAESTVTLALSAAVVHDDAITVGYTKPQTDGIKRSGQALFAESFASLGVTNETPVPLIRSVAANERKIEITFSLELDTDSTPDASAFSLGEDGPSIDSVNVSAMSVSLGLAMALSEGAGYTLTYTAPTESPLATSDAATVASFSETVTNQTDVAPQVQSATANEETISLVFDQTIDSDSALAATDFGVSADPTAGVSAVSYDGDDGLTVTLTRSLVEDEMATLSYVQPSSGGLADPGGKRSASFNLSLDNQTDTAPEPAAGTVKDDMIVITLDQDIFDDTRFRDGYPTDHFTVSGIDSNISVDSIQVSNDGPAGVGKIVIALSKAVDELDTVLVRYFPSTGTIRIREDEDGERRAQINNYQLKNLTKTAPSPESATLDDTSLSLVFDRALDEDVSVKAAWFTVESGNLKVETASVAGSTVTLGVTPSATEDADYELTYSAPDVGGLASASGVLALGFTKSVGNATDYAPFPVSASADASGSVPGANRVVLRFDQRLDPTGSLDSSWFAFTPALEIKAVTVDSDRSEGDQLLIEFTAEHWIREGATAELSYTQPESGGLRDDDGDPEQQGDGNRVATFSIDITNNVDVAPQLTSAGVNRDLILIEFDQTLDSDDDYVPPPNCEWLEANVAGFDCTAANNPTWFTVERTLSGAASSEVASIAEVEVSGNTVTLRLDERTSRGDTVKLSYQVQSVDGAKWNLRDTSLPENVVASFASISVTNVTAAAPTGKTFDRAEPSKIVVAFDGALREDANLSSDPLRVTTDQEMVAVKQVRAERQSLTVDLQRSVPECAALALAYSPNENAWLDDDDRPIVGFRFALENLIDQTLGLVCVESDHGALELTLVAGTRLTDQGWSLQVNGESRALTVDQGAGMIRLVPDAAVCIGDSLTIAWLPSDGSPTISLERAVERAAPCAVSAVAVTDRLELTFDQPLDPSLPSASEFAITANGRVTEVQGIEGRVLTLQLESPGIDADAETTLTYSGTSLQGGGLTVGSLSVPIVNQTEPPKFTTGFGLDDLVILNFDQPLLQRTVAAAWFSLVGPDLEVEIASVTISGSSVQLQLKHSLPDDLDLFGVVYILQGRNGLAGLSGVLVTSGGFVVQNYTETAPLAISATVNAREVVLVLNQQIGAIDAPAADFVVLAGHREIGVSGLEWADETITLTLMEAVTSLDATRLRYSPGSGGMVRDRSGLPLAVFDMSAENLTPSPRTDELLVEQARLRASGGTTSFERELSRAFASADGARFGAAPGDGVQTVMVGGLRLSVQLPDSLKDATGISVSRLSNAGRLMRLLEQVPPACADGSAGNQVSGWLLELQDPNGAPRAQGVEVSLAGLEAARLLGGCVLDLIAGSWQQMPTDGKVAAPSLIVTGATSAFTRWVRRLLGA